MDWKTMATDAGCFVGLMVATVWALVLAAGVAVRLYRLAIPREKGLTFKFPELCAGEGSCAEAEQAEADWREAVSADLAVINELCNRAVQGLGRVAQEVTNPEDDETTLREVVESGPLAGTLFRQLDRLEEKLDRQIHHEETKDTKDDNDGGITLPEVPLEGSPLSIVLGQFGQARALLCILDERAPVKLRAVLTPTECHALDRIVRPDPEACEPGDNAENDNGTDSGRVVRDVSRIPG